MERKEGSAYRRNLTFATVSIVIASIVIASLVYIHYFPEIVSIAPYQKYTTNTTLEPPSNEYSLSIVANNSNIEVHQGSSNVIFVELTATGWARLTSTNVYISTVTNGTDIVISINTPNAFYANTADTSVYLPNASNASLLSLNAQNGNQELYGPLRASKYTISTANGNIGATGVENGSLSASTVNGNLNVKATHLQYFTGTTVNGNVQLTVSSAIENGTFILTSVNGNLDLTMAKSSRAYIDMSSSNGNIATDSLILDAATSTNHSLQGTLNGGGATITMETTNGNMKITGT